MSFKRFEAEDITLSADAITAPVWSEGVNPLADFQRSETQRNSKGQYYLNVYNNNPSAASSEVQFDISYANRLGSGSLQYNTAIPSKSPSSTIYGQYRSLVLGDEDTSFEFGGVTADDFYALSINRARYKEKLLPGTFNLSFSTGLKLTDNSNDVSVVTYKDSGRVYEIVSGSNGSSYDGTGYTTSSGSYGWFLPDIGTILLNAKALDITTAEGVSFGTNRTANYAGYNAELFINNVQGAGTLSEFSLNSEETVTSNYVFVRVRNSEFNYSINPSNITGSGDLRHDSMINAPQAYITSVGLYNDNNDLLGVAKLSKPLLKDFTKEALLRIKLDF